MRRCHPLQPLQPPQRRLSSAPVLRVWSASDLMIAGGGRKGTGGHTENGCSSRQRSCRLTWSGQAIRAIWCSGSALHHNPR